MILAPMLAVLAIGNYGGALSGLFIRLNPHAALPLQWVRGMSILAIIFHTLLLYHWIETHPGQNLTFFNMLSLVAWLIAFLVTLLSFRRPLDNLGLFIFPIAALSILLAWWFPGEHIIDTGNDPRQLIHIILSLLTCSLLGIAALQALLLNIQETHLRQRRTKGIFNVLPPLEVMEHFLFEMLLVGFVFLTITLLTTISFYYPLFMILHGPTIHKLVFSSCAWLIFAWVLVRHFRFGWRGRTVIRWVLVGETILLLSYFGSQLILFSVGV